MINLFLQSNQILNQEKNTEIHFAMQINTDLDKCVLNNHFGKCTLIKEPNKGKLFRQILNFSICPTLIKFNFIFCLIETQEQLGLSLAKLISSLTNYAICASCFQLDCQYRYIRHLNLTHIIRYSLVILDTSIYSY